MRDIRASGEDHIISIACNTTTTRLAWPPQEMKKRQFLLGIELSYGTSATNRSKRCPNKDNMRVCVCVMINAIEVISTWISHLRLGKTHLLHQRLHVKTKIDDILMRTTQNHTKLMYQLTSTYVFCTYEP